MFNILKVIFHTYFCFIFIASGRRAKCSPCFFLVRSRNLILPTFLFSPSENKSLQFSHSVVSDSLQPPWIAACQASLSITNSQSLLKLMSIELVMPPNHLRPCAGHWWKWTSHDVSLHSISLLFVSLYLPFFLSFTPLQPILEYTEIFV